MNNLFQDDISNLFKYTENSSGYGNDTLVDSKAYVWTWTKRSNYSQLIDENGVYFSTSDFLQKFGLDSYVEGDLFPSSVILTKDFTLRTLNYQSKCLCLCKTTDIPIWPVIILTFLMLLCTTTCAYFRFRPAQLT